MEVGGITAAITVSDAVQRFLSDAKARNLSESSLKKYRVLLQGRRSSQRTSMTLEEYAEKHGYQLLKQIDVDVLRDFRQQWKDAPLAARKKLERLRAFFRFALEGGWISVNSALAIKPPLLHDNPTMPLDDEELDQIYSKLAKFVGERKAAARGQATGSDHLDRLKALLLVLEHTGLRILDAIQLNSRQIMHGRLEVRAQKNQGDINLPLPPHVIAELKALRTSEKGLLFWSGEGKPETAAGNYRRTLRELGDYCGVADLHPHRLRDTFAVRLLQSGATLDRVARALGNRSIRVVERHYAPWIQSRQDELDKDVKATWPGGQETRPRLVRVK
jgi:integrase